MKFWKHVLVLFAAFAMLATACGSDDDTTDTGTEAVETDDGAAVDTADEEEPAEEATPAEEEAPAEEEPAEEEAPAESAAGTGGDLLLLQWQAPSQANGLLSSGTKDALASSLVNEPLARFDPAGNIVATLAAEIPTVDNGGVAEDFSSITWKLREGVLWSDGTPFTADDVVFSWEYCADELTGCSIDVSTIESVVADDDLTVTITFTDPKPFPYSDFVGYLSPIIQRAQFQDCVGEQASACTDQNFAPIGTGPYMVTDLRPEDTVTYTFNPNYRGVPDGQPFFTNITIKGGGDAESAARSVLEIGEADYAWNLQVAPEILDPMAAAGNGRVGSGFTANVEHINLNQTDPEGDPPSEYMEDGSTNHPILYQNSELARALSLAIDRSILVQVGYGAAGRPTCTIWPVGDQATTNQDWCLTQDVDQANQILDDLGYEDTDGDGIRETDTGLPLSFDYVTSTNAVRQSNQDLVKDMWSAIGVEVEMRNEDASLFFDGTSASDASIWKFFSDMEMFTNGATIPDPVGYLNGYISENIPSAALGWPSSGDIPRYFSQEYDDTWAELSRTAPTDANYLPLVVKLQDLLIEDGILIPLIHRANVSAWGNDIQNTGDLNGWDSEYWNIQEWTREG